MHELNENLDVNIFYQTNIKTHSFIIEYPGYGTYNSPKSEVQMLEDSLIFYDFLVNELNFHPENIIIFGRSIGTGPATYLASKRISVKMLLLFSPFTRLKEIVKDYFSILSFLVKDRFPNIEHIKNVVCPLLIIHGKKDKIIKWQHSQQLLSEAASKIKKINNPVNMTHNEYKLYDDLIIPAYKFLKIIEKNRIDRNKESYESHMPKLKIINKYRSSKISDLQISKLHDIENMIHNSGKFQRKREDDQINLNASSTEKKKIIQIQKSKNIIEDSSKKKQKFEIFEEINLEREQSIEKKYKSITLDKKSPHPKRYKTTTEHKSIEMLSEMNETDFLPKNLSMRIEKSRSKSINKNKTHTLTNLQTDNQKFEIKKRFESEKNIKEPVFY